VSTAATIVSNAIGTALILLTSRDVMRELFHPRGSGGLSSQVQRRWRQIFKHLSRNHPRRLRHAGAYARDHYHKGSSRSHGG
jgi:hypothetical protein